MAGAARDRGDWRGGGGGGGSQWSGGWDQAEEGRPPLRGQRGGDSGWGAGWGASGGGRGGDGYSGYGRDGYGGGRGGGYRDQGRSYRSGGGYSSSYRDDGYNGGGGGYSSTYREGYSKGGAASRSTDLYLSFVPVDWDEEALVSLHSDSGADTSTITGVKMLTQRKNMGHAFRSAIIQYASHEAASAALDLIKGQPVCSPDGSYNPIVARFAEVNPNRRFDNYEHYDEGWGDYSSKAKTGGGHAREQGASRGGGGGYEAHQSLAPVTMGMRVKNVRTGKIYIVTGVDARGRPHKLIVRGEDDEERARDLSSLVSLDGRELQEPRTVRPHAGLRVVNSKNGRAGVILQTAAGGTNLSIRFDDGTEGWREADHFEAADGRFLATLRQAQAEDDDQTAAGGASQVARVRNWRTGREGAGAAGRDRHEDDTEEGAKGRPVRPTVGLRVRHTKNGRVGTVTQVAGGGSSLNIRFDDGDESWRDTGHFEAADGRQLLGGRQAQNGRDEGGHGGQEYRVGRGDRYREREDRGQEGGKEGRGKGQGRGGAAAGRGAKSLAAQALREVAQQLRRPDTDGRVWIPNWPGRYQATLGHLREFLQAHPHKFRVVMEKGKQRKYKVEFVNPEDAKGPSKDELEEDDEGESEAPAFKFLPSVGTWLQALPGPRQEALGSAGAPDAGLPQAEAEGDGPPPQPSADPPPTGLAA